MVSIDCAATKRAALAAEKGRVRVVRLSFIPFALTLSRMALAGSFAVCLAVFGRGGRPSLGVAAALVAIAIVAELTDLLDGWAARRLGTASKIGGLLDPMADSLARLTIYFALALTGWITIAVPLVMAGRDIVVSYTRVVNAMAGGRTSARFSGKVKAIVQGVGAPVIVALTWLATVVSAPSVSAARIGVAVLVIAVTAWSMVDYICGAYAAMRNNTRGLLRLLSADRAPKR